MVLCVSQGCSKISWWSTFSGFTTVLLVALRTLVFSISTWTDDGLTIATFKTVVMQDSGNIAHAVLSGSGLSVNRYATVLSGEGRRKGRLWRDAKDGRVSITQSFVVPETGMLIKRGTICDVDEILDDVPDAQSQITDGADGSQVRCEV